MMSLELLTRVLGWCTVIDASLLVIWAASFRLMRDGIYSLHGKWFNLAPQHFDAIHYAGMAFFKLCIVLFNLVPYLALRLVVGT